MRCIVRMLKVLSGAVCTFKCVFHIIHYTQCVESVEVCIVHFIVRCTLHTHSVHSLLKVLRAAPYKQPPSRPLSPLHDDNNDGNYDRIRSTLNSGFTLYLYFPLMTNSN